MHSYRDEEARTIARLKEIYPSVSAVRPYGIPDEYSRYLHFIVCHLEYQSLIRLTGAAEAKRVMEVWAGHHYREIYRKVIDDFEAVGALLGVNGILFRAASALDPPRYRPAV